MYGNQLLEGFEDKNAVGHSFPTMNAELVRVTELNYCFRFIRCTKKQLHAFTTEAECIKAHGRRHKLAQLHTWNFDLEKF